MNLASSLLDEETPPTTTSKPPSTWLQRLYASKGFPDSDHQHNSPTHQTETIPQKHNNENGADLINNILSELFCMDENPSTVINKKKTSRKQHSPRIYLLPNIVEKVNASVPKNPNVVGKKVVPLTLTGGKNVRVKVKVRRREAVEHEEEEEEEDDGEEWDVSGYSQTEVTVIDTSVSDWKFDRVLYRKKKKNVWRVGNAKGKGVSMNCGFGNKRKHSHNENANGVYKKKKLKLKFRDSEVNGVEKKKKKKKKLILCNSLSFVDMDGGAPMKSVQISKDKGIMRETG